MVTKNKFSQHKSRRKIMNIISHFMLGFSCVILTLIFVKHKSNSARVVWFCGMSKIHWVLNWRLKLLAKLRSFWNVFSVLKLFTIKLKSIYLFFNFQLLICVKGCFIIYETCVILCSSFPIQQLLLFHLI